MLGKIEKKFFFRFVGRRTFYCSLLLFAIILIAVSLVFFFSSKSQESASQIVDSLSSKDRLRLELFFRNIFSENELGYTLFGDKPMSFCFVNTHPPCFSQRDYTYKIVIEETIPLFGGLEVWKKINPRLNNNNYSFLIYEKNEYPNFVELINKKSFIKEVSANIDLFKQVYGENTTAELILKQLEAKQIDQDALFKHHSLLGIMLGFGRHNAELFQRREELMSDEISLSPIEEEELQYLNQHLQLVTKKNPWFFSVVPVNFVGDPDDVQTHVFAKKYNALHIKLISIFGREDWLEMVLSKLCS